MLNRRDALTISLLGAPLLRPKRAKAVEPGEPSYTAIAVAAARAIGSRNPDPATRNPDSLAEKFLTAHDVKRVKGIAEYDAFRMTWAEVVERAREQSARIFAGHRGVLPFVGINLRTRRFDAAVRDAIAGGAAQIVILGSGLDSRAYRLTKAWDGRVFEVDHPPTQEYKKRKVAAAIGDPPRNLTYAPIDFTRQSLDDALMPRGYRPGAKTLFLWEGVTTYLPKSAVEATLSFVARRAGAGSSIVFDYQDARTITNQDDDEVWKQWAKLSEEWGEPWLFGIPHSGEGNVFQLAASQGLEVKSDLTMGELCVRHLPPSIQPATFGLDRWAWRICEAIRA